MSIRSTQIKEELLNATSKREVDRIIREANLPFLGRGATRKVYVLDGNYALKVALNSLGQDTNHIECDYTFKVPQFAEVVDSHNDDLFIIQELGERKITAAEFKYWAGVSLSEFKNGLYTSISCPVQYVDGDWYEFLNNMSTIIEGDNQYTQEFKEWLNGIHNIISCYGAMLYRDLFRISHIFKFRDGTYKLIDYGLLRDNMVRFQKEKK